MVMSFVGMGNRTVERMIERERERATRSKGLRAGLHVSLFSYLSLAVVSLKAKSPQKYLYKLKNIFVIFLMGFKTHILQ